jgi:hypothetical protein
MSRIINFKRIINFEEGWGFIQNGIKMFNNVIEGETQIETQITSADYQMLYAYASIHD